MRDARNRDVVLHVREAVEEVVGLHPQLPEHRPQLLVQLLLRRFVRGRVGERQLPVAVDGDAVPRHRQVLGREPEVDRVLGDPLERELRREPRLHRLLAAVHGRLRLADHLDVPERVVVAVAGEVEVVQPERLLEDRRVLVLREREHGRAVVEHVVAADLVGAVREPLRVLLGGGDQQQLGGVGRAAGEHHDVRGIALELAVTLDHDLRHRRPVAVRLELDHLRVRQQLDVLVLERRPHAEHLRVRLAVHRAREAVAVFAADAGAVGQIRLVQADPARRVERVVAGGLEVVRSCWMRGSCETAGNG